MNNVMPSESKNTRHGVQERVSIIIIVALIIFDVVCDNVILINFNKETPLVEFILFVGLLFLQIIASPIQSGLSDFYGRKRSLIVAVSASLLSLVVLFLYGSAWFPFFIVLVLTNLIKGLLGNTIPIVWSAIGDTESKNERFFFAISEAAYALGYLLIFFLNPHLSDNGWLFLLMSLAPVLLYILIKGFKDKKDIVQEQKKSIYSHVINEPRLVFNDLKDRSLRLLSYSFTLWEISLYCILILYADFSKSSLVGVSMMCGYIFGSYAMKHFTKYSDRTMMKLGYIISIFSLVPYLTTLFFVEEVYYLLVGGYFFHAIGNAILCPTLLSMVSTGIAVHQKGKRYGILESFDTLAFLISSIIIMIYNALCLKIIYMVVFSFLTILFSLVPYKKFTQLRADGLK